ncbi:DUF6538 domain-containing protein [uncultured Victivallis sp.]|uniref:DUF6538 domain-containing protein n=1 Tax=uncultured Victivallis sp. TaxID=354118 RepID=UPI0025959B08|nr:DUF6538 domain-containing protein [uncultured Victivallis sp.]
MDVTVRNLVSRGNRFYFRYRLPANYLPGKIREIKISLKTNDLKRAVVCCKLASEKVKTLIDTGKYMKVSMQEMRQITADYISHLLEDHARQMAEYGPMDAETQREGAEMALHAMKYYEQSANDPAKTPSLVIAKTLLKDIPHEQGDIDFLAHEILRASLFSQKMQYERIMGRGYLTEFDSTVYNEVMTGRYRTADQIREADMVYPLGEMVKNYLEAPHPTWGYSMRNAIESSLKMLMDYFSPGTDIKAITMDNMEYFLNKILMKLPANRTTNPKYSKMSLEEAAKANTSKTLALKTVNTHMSNISAFFHWNYKRKRIDRNPAEDFVIKLKPKKEDSRTLFNDEDLKKSLNISGKIS